jgi:RNA recognition motif-containing protein
MNTVHLEVASKKFKCFRLDTEHGQGRLCRFLPFVDTLSRNPEVEQSENLNMTDLENMPDNTQRQTNLCIKHLDESLTEEDLHLMFRKFGEIKSAKVARDPTNSKSLGYGYVWFADEFDCAAAIKAAQEQRIGYQCEFY